MKKKAANVKSEKSDAAKTAKKPAAKAAATKVTKPQKPEKPKKVLVKEKTAKVVLKPVVKPVKKEPLVKPVVPPVAPPPPKITPSKLHTTPKPAASVVKPAIKAAPAAPAAASRVPVPPIGQGAAAASRVPAPPVGRGAATSAAPTATPVPPATKPKIEAAPIPPPASVEAKPSVPTKEIEITLPITVKDLSVKMQEKPSVLIKKLMDMRFMAGINQALDEETATKVCTAFGFTIKKALAREEAVLAMHNEPDTAEQRKFRAPVVTLMGHVDHGKTSLLDAIRKSQVVEKEFGGITQHIGAYRVTLPKGKITFLDTPGHEAFSAMRARGASCTDIVVLVVAADDGIMPQTIEALDHARAAGVPVIVALNKIDKQQAEPDRVKKQLAEHGLQAEDWGGKTIVVGVSAKTGKGISDLLDMILLEAEMLELKANYDKLASGVVVEAKISKGKGPIATLLVQNGTLHEGDYIVVGKLYGKIRSMHNDQGKLEEKAEPAEPVEISGLSGVPEAGERFYVVEDEKTAKEISSKRHEAGRMEEMKTVKRVSLDDLYKDIKEGKLKELKIILKADVRGSLEAIKEAIRKLAITEIQLNIIHEGIGQINTSDIILAAASDALVLGFNVDADALAKEMIAKEGVDARTYNIIYELTNELKVALEGMLEPKLKKVFVGRAEVRKVFKLTKAGIVAGSFVSKGKITRQADIAVMRNGDVVFEGKISTLKHLKDDVREAVEGFECGISINGFDTVQEGDIIEAFEIQRITRKL